MKTTSKTPRARNAVIYSGPSLIDGAPIVVIAILKTGNSKTGQMIQTHIIRADMHPLDASKTGADASICGACIHRGTPTNDPARKQATGRTCYVNLGQGPTQVFKAYRAGKYPQVTDPASIAALGHGRMIRLGTYGDPAAVPAGVWDALLSRSAGHTAYTHQHDRNDPSTYRRMMYSADSAADAQQAHAKGYRTFRVIPVSAWQAEGKKTLMPSETLCPASAEAGKRATCDKCRLCAGSDTRARNIAIVAHGTSRRGVK